MFDLVQLTDTAYVIECPSRIGLVKTASDEVVLIDSGNNKDAGRRILKILNERSWRLRAVYNTHFHADTSEATICCKNGQAVQSMLPQGSWDLS